ncbi:MAG: DoxX family protein [Bacteroidota bacterium]
MLDAIIGTHHSFAALVLRLVLGYIFINHGWPKLFKKEFGPKGLAGFLKTLNIPFPLLFAYAAGIAEFFGGVLLILGLLTRVDALLIAIVMIVAMWKVKFKTGLMTRVMEGNRVGGYELDLALFAIAVALIVSGGGTFSLDCFLR